MHNFRVVYLNGQFIPPSQALVSVFDRGFIFGDGIYEVIPVFGRRLFRLPHHLARLDRSFNEIKLKNPLNAAQWEAIFTRLIRECDAADQSVYVQVTRGAAPRDHAFPANPEPTIFAYAQPLKVPTADVLARGVAVITAPDNRWQRCDIKAVSLLPNTLLRQQAVERGANEAILIRDGMVTEGSSSNVFVVRRGVIYTPPKGPFILPGITRDLVLELAAAHGLPAREEPIAQTALTDADEIWLTSSMREILPVTRIDDRAVADGKPGPLHARMYSWYQSYKQAVCEGKAA